MRDPDLRADPVLAAIDDELTLAEAEAGDVRATLAEIERRVAALRRAREALVGGPKEAVMVPDGPTADMSDGGPDMSEGASGERLVSLAEAADRCGRAKRTLERMRSRGMLPEPTRPGGGGHEALWRWSELRPALEGTARNVLRDSNPTPESDCAGPVLVRRSPERRRWWAWSVERGSFTSVEFVAAFGESSWATWGKVLRKLVKEGAAAREPDESWHSTERWGRQPFRYRVVGAEVAPVEHEEPAAPVAAQPAAAVEVETAPVVRAPDPHQIRTRPAPPAPPTGELLPRVEEALRRAVRDLAKRLAFGSELTEQGFMALLHHSRDWDLESVPARAAVVHELGCLAAEGVIRVAREGAFGRVYVRSRTEEVA